MEGPGAHVASPVLLPALPHRSRELRLSDGRVKPLVASSVDVVLVIVLLLLMALTQPKPLLVEGARPEV